MAKINLLPSDLIPKVENVRVAGVIKKISISMLTVMITAFAFAGGLMIFNNFQKNNIVKKNDGLALQVKSLEKTEIGLILIKDRVNYAQQILDTEQSVLKSEKIKYLVDLLPLDAAISKISYLNGKINLMVEFTGLSSLNVYSDKIIVAARDYTSAKIVSLAQVGGKYQLSLEFML